MLEKQWLLCSYSSFCQYHGGLLCCQVEAVWETKAEPNVISISCVGSAMEKAGEWQQTLTLLGDMQVTWVEHHWSHGLYKFAFMDSGKFGECKRTRTGFKVTERY